MKIRELGMSLVEIMVAVVIGMIGILIITQAYITSDNFNRSTLGEGGAQTNGLVALYTVERDVRMAGYGIASSGALGCGNIYWYYDPAYSANVGGGSLPNIQLAPVVITTDTTAPLTDPDQITIMYATEADRMLPTSISAFNAASSVVTVDGTFGFQDGDIVLFVGSTGCTMGKITNVMGAAQKLQLNPGASAPQNPPAWGSFPTSYANGDSILNLGNPIVRTYSIANRKLRVTDALLLAAGNTPIDLVDGIVDLRAQYGKDTNNDNVIDTWDQTTPATSAAWGGVLAVRMGILARIGNFQRPTTGPGTDCDATLPANAPTWTGGGFAAINLTTTTSEDRCYRYRVFETTIPLRNMIWRGS